jgi:hypothetical protein
MASARTNFNHVGILEQVKLASGAATAASGAATVNAQVGTVTSESLTTAAGATYTLTLTNTYVDSSSKVFANAYLGSSTQGTPQVVGCTPAAGQVTVVVKNIHATLAFNGSIKVDFLVINPA